MWRQINHVLLGALFVVGCAACGDEGGDEPEPNDPTEPELSFEDSEPNNNSSAATPIEVGSRITGTIGAEQQNQPDVDVYEFEARAGTIVEFGVESVGGELDSELGPQVRVRLRDERGDYLRDLYADISPNREAYILLTGTYYLEVRDLPSALDQEGSLGGEDSTYSVTLVESDWRTRPLVPPTSTRDNWINRGVDGFEFTTQNATFWSVETTAQREPVSGDLDTTVSVWDATDGRLVGSNDDILVGSEPTLDSRVTFTSVPQHDYIVIVDPIEVIRDPAAVEYNTDYDVSVSLGQ